MGFKHTLIIVISFDASHSEPSTASISEVISYLLTHSIQSKSIKQTITFEVPH